MKVPQIRLKLFLDKLGMPSQIKSLEDRIAIQKAVYIGQKAGVDLAYSYGWYVHGPYSPELTKDYFALDNDLALGDNEYENYDLLDDMSTALERVRPILDPPSEAELSRTEWLELVASVLFLLDKNNSKAMVEKEIKEKKPHLCDHFEMAYRQIGKYGLN
jgi:hypothetical protein